MRKGEITITITVDDSTQAFVEKTTDAKILERAITRVTDLAFEELKALNAKDIGFQFYIGSHYPGH